MTFGGHMSHRIILNHFCHAEYSNNSDNTRMRIGFAFKTNSVKGSSYGVSRHSAGRTVFISRLDFFCQDKF